MDNRPVGIFDSGVGGLSAVKAMLQAAPNESIIYFGDTARVPYGNKSRNEITCLSMQDVNFLRIFNLKTILIACNTITANCIDALRAANQDIPIIGVVESAASAAAEATRNKKIGVIATQATVESGIYRQKLEDTLPGVKVFEQKCPKFVPLIERGHISPDDPKLIPVVEEYCRGLKDENVDVVILGCTHYPLIQEAIRNYMGSGVTLIDSGGESVKAVLKGLSEKNQKAAPLIKGSDKYFCSGDVGRFGTVANMFLQKNIQPYASEINIERF